jgi:hypothetical protein
MKMIFKLSLLTAVLMAASGPCFALQENKVVSTQEAKAMGVAMRSHPDGDAGTKVSLEFKTQGALKNFTRVELEVVSAGTNLVSAPLLTSRPTPDSVSVYFSADPSWLATSVLVIVVQDGPETRIGYMLRVKDFIGP